MRVRCPFWVSVILLPEEFQYPRRAPGAFGLGHDITDEIGGIAVGLKADDVILQQQRHQPFVIGQRGQHLRRRHRDVKKEPDAVSMTASPQRVGDRDEVIIVNPDHVVGFDDLFEFRGETVIDAEIATQIAAGKLGEIKAVMEDWPQHPIGKAVVIFLVIFPREIGDDIFDVVVVEFAGRQLVGRSHLTAPAEPHAAVSGQCRPQCHFETARPLGTIARGHRNPVGNDH